MLNGFPLCVTQALGGKISHTCLFISFSVEIPNKDLLGACTV